ncbi:hypothetical protein AN960_21800 [Bacillus sp. FJAT-25509]|uniref:hypothetical protein n=1 Tax=Bacillus sp. FJAT-25509 TaxID=1712029 RepID=UPI0006F42B93|nr:hypothetical protein [Bacillus sp. FJAT-25509]KQL33049.1 hypothetical protein AN960_21800 [Bacillus sp. FJAT-25509]
MTKFTSDKKLIAVKRYLEGNGEYGFIILNCQINSLLQRKATRIIPGGFFSKYHLILHFS